MGTGLGGGCGSRKKMGRRLHGRSWIIGILKSCFTPATRLPRHGSNTSPMFYRVFKNWFDPVLAWRSRIMSADNTPPRSLFSALSRRILYVSNSMTDTRAEYASVDLSTCLCISVIWWDRACSASIALWIAGDICALKNVPLSKYIPKCFNLLVMVVI